MSSQSNSRNSRLSHESTTEPSQAHDRTVDGQMDASPPFVGPQPSFPQIAEGQSDGPTRLAMVDFQGDFASGQRTESDPTPELGTFADTEDDPDLRA